MELTDRTAVVTGAASGIGLALTERLLDEGMSVVMADEKLTVLEGELMRALCAALDSPLPPLLDITEPVQ